MYVVAYLSYAVLRNRQYFKVFTEPFPIFTCVCNFTIQCPYWANIASFRKLMKIAIIYILY